MMIYLRIAIVSIIPTALMFLGKNETCWAYLVRKNIMGEPSVTGWQLGCFIIGFFWAGLVIPVTLAHTKKQLAEVSKSFQELMRHHKNSLFQVLTKEIKAHNHPFRTRVFVPQKWYKRPIEAMWTKESFLYLTNIDGLSDEPPAKQLKFIVSKNRVEGMVGKSFSEKTICLDMDLSNHLTYNLSDAQKIKVGNVKFCATIPILSNQDSVSAVIAVDSDDELNLDEAQQQIFTNHLKVYAAFIDKHYKF